MSKRSKRYTELLKGYDKNNSYPIEEAVKIVKSLSTAKFDETIELSVKTGIDPKKNEQQIRNTVTLPNGTGKKIRILVFAVGPEAEEAKNAGADYVGGEELAKRVTDEGFLDFDVAIASPDAMRFVGKLGRVLGPRGLMPSPKSGTVTKEIGKAVESFKAGRVEVRNDKTGNLHLPVGKKSFADEKIAGNVNSALEQVKVLRPQGLKGRFMQKVVISPTMGPSVKLEFSKFEN